jgi:hypothetical protein
MPADIREITRADLIADADFRDQRKERRAALLPMKRLRRVALGPYCTFYFESFDTMLFQVQEMLLIEKGGEAQIPDELAAYNPLIPKGEELVATLMFELDDPVRRENFLSGLGGIEEHFYIEVDGSRISGISDSDVERTRDGKTSSVHFLRFPFNRAQIAAFGDSSKQVMLGCDDQRYAHMTRLSPETRTELERDFNA